MKDHLAYFLRRKMQWRRFVLEIGATSAEGAKEVGCRERVSSLYWRRGQGRELCPLPGKIFDF